MGFINILINAILKIKPLQYKQKPGDICLSEFKTCQIDEHSFPIVMTKNGYRLDSESPCKCSKYTNETEYYIEQEM